MSQRLGFWKDCWIYTNKTERANIRFILTFLKKRKSVCLTELVRINKGSIHAMRNAALYLLAARIIRVQQHKEVRVYTFTDNWLLNLKKMTNPPSNVYSKTYHNGEIYPVSKETVQSEVIEENGG